MTQVKDFIVVEFDFQARFIKKRTLSEYNESLKEQWRNGHYFKFLTLMGVFETEKEADKFISEFKDIDTLIDAVLRQEEPF